MKKYTLPEINVAEFKAVDIVTTSGEVVNNIITNNSSEAFTFSSDAGVEYIG